MVRKRANASAGSGSEPRLEGDGGVDAVDAGAEGGSGSESNGGAVPEP